METTDGAPQALTPRPTWQRVRAISTTSAFVLASVVIECVISFMISSVILPSYINEDSFNRRAVFAIAYFIGLLLPVAPAATGGMYWLALRGLQHNRVPIVWLNVTGLGMTFFLVTSVLTSIVDITAGRIIYQNYYYTHDERYAAAFQWITAYPYLLLVALVLAGFFALVIVNIARFFTKQRPAHAQSPTKQNWRDIGAIWGLTTFIIFACSISQILINTYLTSTGSFQGGALLFYIALIISIYLIIPTGIVAAIACADMLRALQGPRVANIPAEPSDPFVSSDGSFSLSFSPITEND